MRAITRRSCSLTIFFDERPDGRRTVDKVRWNVHAIVCPRSRFLEVRTSEEFSPGVPGVYVLSSLSIPYGKDDIPTIYIGQSDQLRRRLERHWRDPKKGFWTALIVFTSSSKSFTTAHAEYLESELISLAKKVKRCLLDQNNQVPRTLADDEKAAMDVFLKEMVLICNQLGLTAFEGPPLWPKPDVPPRPTKLR